MSNASLIWALAVAFAREAGVLIIIALFIAAVIAASLLAGFTVIEHFLEQSPQQSDRPDVRSGPSGRHFDGWL